MSLRKTQGFVSVGVAIAGNGFVTILKFIAATVSGSSVMFSEAIHSLADTTNQVLLLVGLNQSLRKADDKHEYGYGTERFFWALISACGIFFLGAGITLVHSVEALLHPEEVVFSPLVFGVLLIALVVEAYTLVVAVKEIKRHFPGLSWAERLQEADSATLAVLLEDSVAVLGVMVAAGSIGLAYYTGNPAWDALGGLVIAVLLAFVAVFLIIRNREYLLGRALSEEIREEVIELLNKEPSIDKVIDFKSSALAFGVYRIKCEVEFNGASLLKEAYRGQTMRDQYDEIDGDFEEFKKFNAYFADRIPRLIGKKVDDIEAKIKKAFPMIRHIDIEIN
ncbi:cation diffusion facilitator family transporter [Patescibacteria group bacterium]|nr:cation diffusion facilitator family transporter [Patescibacteria group bacterium]